MSAGSVMTGLPLPEVLFTVVALILALWFRPWRMLRGAQLQHPWLAALVLLPWAWSVGNGLGTTGAVVQVSGACLLVLMVGWPLAVWTLLPVALAGAWIGGHAPPHVAEVLAWFGIMPATLALAAGWAIRRWLPNHLFVYIFGRGFFATAFAVTVCGALHVWIEGAPRGLDMVDMLVGHWLIGWGEAMATGMLVATMVAFRPQWLATYSDRRYLPRR
jgi:uncharacterized membrane protein